MIGDVLSGCVHRIDEYLNDPIFDRTYQGALRDRIIRLRNEAEHLRASLDLLTWLPVKILSLRDVARWYWGLYDDMDFPEAESFDKLTDQEIFQVLREIFVSSDCGDFAIALHELTGWRLMNFASPTEGRAHSAVLHPTGSIVDFEGFVTLSALCKRYAMHDLIMEEATVKNVVGTSGDSIEENGITGIHRAKITIRLLNYPPFDLIN
jgi:hypothetical protein